MYFENLIVKLYVLYFINMQMIFVQIIFYLLFDP